jgi:hypothetical protein
MLEDNKQEDTMDEKAILESERLRVKGFMALVRAYPDQASMIEKDMESGAEIAETVSKCVAAVADKAAAAAEVDAAKSEDVPDIGPASATITAASKPENPFARAFSALGISAKE